MVAGTLLLVRHQNVRLGGRFEDRQIILLALQEKCPGTISHATWRQTMRCYSLLRRYPNQYYTKHFRKLTLFCTYLGQQDDARMNLAIALTATRHGATVANHVSVTGLIKEKQENGKETIAGVHVKDEITGKEWTVPAKCVVNATGPFTDSIRKLDNPTIKEICAPSSGVHIVLPGR